MGGRGAQRTAEERGCIVADLGGAITHDIAVLFARRDVTNTVTESVDCADDAGRTLYRRGWTMTRDEIIRAIEERAVGEDKLVEAEG